ncbi:MAG: nucleoside-diphosphate kinase [Promethearchaeota archaeon]
MSRTLVFLKPEATCHPQVAAKVLKRLLDEGLELLSVKKTRVTKEQALEHYAEHAMKPFYGTLEAQVTACPVIVCVFQGEDAVKRVRALSGATFVENATRDSIRGEFGLYKGLNVIHASDSEESAEREITLWTKFGAVEIDPEGAKEWAESFIAAWVEKPDLTAEFRESIHKILEEKEKIRALLEQGILEPDITGEDVEHLLRMIFLYIAE